ncbi:TonB-dependent receptor [Flavobacteriaceae bacterium XHP0103]|uniref:SusC/RagA family TonB-linked outer membrane protein n=1 Tax=Marixanthotalea marina TaxID=2844359 RepID=UPI002989AA3E|nr:TonB-dependent receptor [Marixanthotalea marina]MBU3821487.1 TonB-dependent receptor [Marixanthotalea marina]
MTKILFSKSKRGVLHLGFLMLSFLFCAAVNAQTTVSGTVSDQNGPLLGVTILVEGTNNGTATDFNGNYTLNNVTSNAKLVFSSVGYATQQIDVNGQSTINVLMSEDMQALDQIVVVGYSTQSKSTLTGAVSTMKAEDVESIPAPNVTQSMAGRVTGIIMRANGGGPGGDNPDINIRGIATTGNNAPLVVVDGIRRNNINQVDPASIESVTILKDAAAIAPFGIGGANGVILITTKKGKSGKPVVRVSSSYAFQNPTYIPDMLNAQDYMRLQNEGYFNLNPNGTTPPNDPAMVADYNNLHASDPYRYPDSDFTEEFNDNFGTMMNNVEISGGTDAVKYYAGLGHYDQEGLFDPLGYKRYTYNMSIDAQVTSTTKFGMSVRGSMERTKGFDGGQGVVGLLRSLYKFFPTRTLRYPEGDKWGESSASSPVGLIEADGYSRDDRNTLLSSVYLEQELPFIKGLSVKGVFSYDPTQFTNKDWHVPNIYHNIDLNANPYTFTETITTQEGRAAVFTWLGQGYSKNVNYTYQGYINYKRTFGDHDVTGLFVAEAQKNTNENFNARRNNFALQIDELSLGSSNRLDYDNGGGSGTGSNIGYVYRVGYAYKNKYIFEASGRYDGHYAFAPGSRWGYFPAFSAAWRISEEKFMDNVDFVNNLKVRGSWGKSGNLPTGGAFQYLSGYNLYGNSYAFGNGNLVQGSFEGSEANPNITWEVSTKFDIGFELGLFDNMLDLEFGYFHEERTGMLLAPQVTLPVEYGLGIAQENKGSMENNGIELSLGYRKTWESGLSVSANLNYSYAKNKQIEVFQNDAQAANPNRTLVGRQLNTPFGYKSLGLFTTEEDTNNDGIINATDGYNVTQFGELHPGDVKYADIDGDGDIDNDDIVPIGNPTYPSSIYGLNTNIAFKGFSLTMFFQGAGNSDININTFLTSPFDNNGSNTSYEYYNNRWTPDNQGAKYPRATPSPYTNNTRGSDFWMVDTSYLRLKTLVLGYSLPQDISNMLGMQSIALNITGQNLLTFSKLDFVDPELGYSNRETAYPVIKSLAFGINFSF